MKNSHRSAVEPQKWPTVRRLWAGNRRIDWPIRSSGAAGRKKPAMKSQLTTVGWNLRPWPSTVRWTSEKYANWKSAAAAGAILRRVLILERTCHVIHLLTWWTVENEDVQFPAVSSEFSLFFFPADCYELVTWTWRNTNDPLRPARAPTSDWLVSHPLTGRLRGEAGGSTSLPPPWWTGWGMGWGRPISCQGGKMELHPTYFEWKNR